MSSRPAQSASTSTASTRWGASDPSSTWSDAPNRARTGLETALALALVALVGSRLSFEYGLNAGAVLALALAPVWLGRVARYRHLPLLFVMLPLSAVTGILLSLGTTSHQILPSAVVERTAMLLSLAGGIGAVMFAHTRVTMSWVAVSYGTGMLAVAPLAGATDNPWRFTYSLPVIVLLLGLLAVRNRVVPQLAALAVLAVVGILNDSRSNSTMLLLSAAVLFWNRVVPSIFSTHRRAGNLVGVAVFGFALFQLVQRAIVDGFFGEVTQQRTVAQIERGGSLLLGGRPEIAASRALIERFPFGMGSGTVANTQDVMAAQQAMWNIGYDPNNRYVTNYLFGGGVEVHSMLGDFWLWFGLAGLITIVMMGIVILSGLGASLREGTLCALTMYLAVRFVWDLAFSPASTSMVFVILALPFVASWRASSDRAVAAGAAAEPLLTANQSDRLPRRRD